jgi:RNA polymerase sigma-70 factor, ECF subfamily
MTEAETKDVEPAVLERARGGDQRAFALVVRHYDPGLRALAHRILGDRDRMDDALQEAYAHAFRALPRFEAIRRSGHGFTASPTTPASTS